MSILSKVFAKWVSIIFSVIGFAIVYHFSHPLNALYFPLRLDVAKSTVRLNGQSPCINDLSRETLYYFLVKKMNIGVLKIGYQITKDSQIYIRICQTKKRKFLNLKLNHNLPANDLRGKN